MWLNCVCGGGQTLHFSGVFALGGDTNFNFQRAISPELLDLEPSFFYENNSINLFYNSKKPGCITSNRKHDEVRLG